MALKSFGFDFQLFDFQSKGTTYAFHISNILVAFFILLTARLASWLLIQLVLNSYYRRNSINVGSQYAINQLLKYFLYVIAFLMALEALGVTLTVLWGGAAALLVGLGLGLQETFKDFFSGIILLFERTVEVGDVVVVDGTVGTVRRIGLRTSLVETRDNLTVIVPNSRLVVEKVINWSHNDNKARFLVKVGVAYGTDTALVKKLLLNVARENAFVIRHPPPFVRFTDFGESSLDFEIHFWTHEFIRIEDVKSDMRFEIDKAFRENQVTIPFPQRDVWMKGEG
ncbi:MAG: mechanosensitive ion channel [Lewinellaceae bacterium]|nr:mechanosensitive ion channel [Lewinellaceae bacterium]